MKTIAVVRKPIKKNVATNVLVHGCGGLNIDAARIKTTDSTTRTQNPQNNGGSMSEGEWKGGKTGSENGRWPANVILRHLDGCRRVEDDGDDMKTIAITRKPLAGTVASNTLEHGCGGLNIDAGRIDTGGEVLSCSKADPYHAADGTQRTWNPTSTRGIDRVQHQSGRWPANLILQHLDECRCDGVKKVTTNVQHHSYKRSGEGFIGSIKSQPEKAHWTNKETVANWICAEGCPAKALDQQSGTVPTGSWVRPEKAYNFYLEKDGAPGKHEEWRSVKEPESGASRFFKNIKDDLVSYLRDLITPPDGVVEVVPLDILEPTGEDESVHGFIVMGTPTQEQANELLRICKPGAHVLLIAPEEQPTGHTGMCRLEDAGFEIRDTIMLLLEAGGFWYVPKPTKTEREAGTHNQQQDVTRREGHVGGDTPRNRGFKARGNSHPTVKPYAIMEALMKDATKTLPVVDPFMGSGSTGIAALHTGHDFIGIEREEDYMKIADARIRHWDQAAWRGHSVKIQSDVEQYTEADEGISLSDLFGSGG
mgnify:CR=1 FL=1